MTKTMRAPLLTAIVVAAISWAACGKTPTTPTDPTPTSAPHIVQVSPTSLTTSVGPQDLTVTGTNFSTNITLSIVEPDGSVLTLSGGDIQSLSTTSFHVQVQLPIAGSYGFTLKNFNGDTSDLFAVTVQDNGSQSGGPVVLSVAPSVVQRNTNPQNFSVAGTGFVDGLSVIVTAPDGSSVTLIGGNVSGVTSTTFNMTATLSKVGAYSFQVINPTGDSSNLVTVTATQ